MSLAPGEEECRLWSVLQLLLMPLDAGGPGPKRINCKAWIIFCSKLVFGGRQREA